MVRVGILGASGYTALELIKLLLRHPEVEIAVLTGRQEGEPRISTLHPQLTRRLDCLVENIPPLAAAERVDCIFSCLPHAASAQALLPLLNRDVRIIDLSADFRLWDADLYSRWYGEVHPASHLLSTIPYGLPELFRSQIVGAKIVANPGCYPTSAILALTPLLRMGFIANTDVIVDSKSGVSGAGRTPKLTTHYPECNESISAYSVGIHRHTPEISQILSHAAAAQVEVLFTPHLTPMDRGILTTCYAHLTAELSESDLLHRVREYYAAEPFIRVVDHLPATKDTSGSNFCDITLRVVGSRVVTISCLDNLIKGASGAAIQNFNLMFGFPETTALS